MTIAGYHTGSVATERTAGIVDVGFGIYPKH